MPNKRVLRSLFKCAPIEAAIKLRSEHHTEWERQATTDDGNDGKQRKKCGLRGMESLRKSDQRYRIPFGLTWRRRYNAIYCNFVQCETKHNLLRTSNVVVVLHRCAVNDCLGFLLSVRRETRLHNSPQPCIIDYAVMLDFLLLFSFDRNGNGRASDAFE